MTSLPLAGVRVLDLSRALAGPLASSLLGDLGADVVKVEPISGGDPSRAWSPNDGTESLYFAAVNRNKRSLAINLRTPDAREILQRLIANSDVLIESFRPGVLSEMGLDPVQLRKAHPALVIVSISGFGSSGPYRELPGLDQVAQGMSGLISVTGMDKDNTVRVGVPIVDFMTGVHAALGAAAALAGVAHSGIGSHVEISLIETSLSSLVFQAQQYLSTGVIPVPQGNSHPSISPYGAFRTATNPITIAVGTEKHWLSVCEIIGPASLVDDRRFGTATLRSRNKDVLADLLENQLEHHTADEWIDRLRNVGVPCGPIYDVGQALSDPQVESLEIIGQVTRDDGWSTRMLRSPFRLDDERPEIRIPPPVLGEHSADVLHEAGFSSEQVREWEAAGIIANLLFRDKVNG
jgi:CoA:oxalate CoA-transferase